MNLIEIPENDKDTAYHYRNYLFLIHNKNECIAESIFTAMSADFVDAGDFLFRRAQSIS